MQLLFFGSDRFSRLCLQQMLIRNASLRKGLAVCCPPNAKGMAQAQEINLVIGELLQMARSSGIKHFILPPKTLKDWTFEEEYDLGLAVSIGYFIPSRIISRFPLGMLNAHPTILPKYHSTWLE
jgi:methionyl-tRNA formyltransferase